MMTERPSGRAFDQLRDIQLVTNVSKYAEGSCLAKFGDTHVLCTASIDSGTPRWLKGTGLGCVTAEYGMLPRATHSRMDREAARGKQSGRTQEIQRLIGRSLRAITDRKAMGERQVKVDCDVIQADGGTRTAAITGSYVALHLAFSSLVKLGALESVPLTSAIAAISCGIWQGTPLLDLDYDEDSSCATDSNFVLTGTGGIVEIQATAEQEPFQESEFDELLRLARKGIGELVQHQNKALGLG
jgi:ribonuclease PH